MSEVELREKEKGEESIRLTGIIYQNTLTHHTLQTYPGNYVDTAGS